MTIGWYKVIALKYTVCRGFEKAADGENSSIPDNSINRQNTTFDFIVVLTDRGRKKHHAEMSPVLLPL